MTTRTATLLLGLSLLASTAGCDDDDEITTVCKKMAEIAANDQKAPESMKDIEKCKAQAAADQKQDPERFKKNTACIMGVSDLAGVIACVSDERADGGSAKSE